MKLTQRKAIRMHSRTRSNRNTGWSECTKEQFQISQITANSVRGFVALPPIHTGCAGAYARRYARSVPGSKFAVFGALRLFRVCVMHACSDTVRNVVRECVACNRIWVSTPKICMTHDVVTGCGIPNKFKLFSNCWVLLVTSAKMACALRMKKLTPHRSFVRAQLLHPRCCIYEWSPSSDVVV